LLPIIAVLSIVAALVAVAGALEAVHWRRFTSAFLRNCELKGDDARIQALELEYNRYKQASFVQRAFIFPSIPVQKESGEGLLSEKQYSDRRATRV
jgi:hypothetical protein